MELMEIKKVKVPLEESKYLKTYQLIWEADAALETAKVDLMCGRSPYVTLARVQKLAEQAQTEWHTQQSKEG